MTATKTLRDIAAIEAGLALVRKLLDGIAASNKRICAEPSHTDLFVVGFAYGLFLNAAGTLGAVEGSRLFNDHAAARVVAARVRNGAGSPAIVMSYDDALDLCLSQNEQTEKVARECLAGLVDERAAWEDAQRKADLSRGDDWAEDLAAYHAYMDRKADEADYHDQWR